jgi:ATP-dependent exoDNAse (exonuclease V) alpha subunit
VQNAAYISGEKLHEERRGITANYSNRDDVCYAETLAPEWAGDEFRNTEKAWNLLENYEDKYALEKYKTPETQNKYMQSARTAMKLVLALPKELSEEQNKELALSFANKAYVSNGHVVTVAIHSDEGNPHAHLLISHRQINKDGTISYTKNREMCTVLGIKGHREMWANEQNLFLEKEGFDVRVDHRSYKDQGIDLVPTVHEGWYAKSLADKGLPSRPVEENIRIREENQQRISEYPEIIFNDLTSKRATFSELDVLKVVQNRTLDHPHLAQHVFEEVINKSVHIGHGFDRHKRFTSPEYHQKEETLLQGIEKLSTVVVDRKIDQLSIQSQLNHHRSLGDQISSQQEDAVKVLCADKAVTVLVGRAGTGKTTSVLKPVVALHQGAGFKVMGMALAAEAAKNLAVETGCKAETISYYTYRWKQIPQLEAALATDKLSDKERNKALRDLESYQKTLPTKDTVIIVDEAGMVGTKDWYQLVSMAYATGAKLIVCGDDHQYKAIDAGDVFRKSIELADAKGCMAEVSYIFRQTPDWMKQASMDLAQLETTTALMAYENKGYVREAETASEMVTLMARDYVEKIKNNCTHSGVVLTSTNDTRLDLNKEIREQLQAQGLLNEDSVQHQGKGLALGERIVFLTNDRGQYHVKSSSGDFAVKNGTQGTIESIEPILIADEKRDRTGHVVSLKEMSSQLTVRISANEKVTFTLSDYKHIDHAYALTGHKSQGQTVDWSMVHLSQNLDAYGLYVMMTRHRDDVTLYHNKEEVASFSKFADNIRVGYKDLAVDYTIKSENYEAYFNVEDYKALGREILQLIKHKGELGAQKNKGENQAILAPEKDSSPSPSTENHTLSTPSLADLLKERKDLARLIVDERENHKLFVMQAGLTFEKLEITAGLKDRPLTLIEQKAQVTVEQYGAVALEARNMWQEIRKTAPGSHAKSHPYYPRFDELRHERGRIANIIMEAQTLHHPFLKDVTKDLGYGVSTIQKQATLFQSKQLMQTLQQEGLDHGTSQKLTILAAYVDARDQFAQTWKELKPQLKEAEGTLLKPTLDAQVQTMRHLSNERDKLAYRIVDRFDEYHPLATSLQITLDTPKIFTQSENGHRQTCIEQYLKGETQLGKGMAAFELNWLWQAEKEIGSKATVRDLLQNKINLLEVRSEAQAFDRIQLQGTLTTDQDKQLFKDLNHYQNIKDTAGDHYKLCLEEATEKGIKPWESSYYPSYAVVNKEKDAAAYTLIKQPYPAVESMAEKMSVSLKNLDQEAHRHDLRETSQIYLSGMGAHSVLAAKELRARLDFDRESGSKQTYGMLAESKILPKELLTHIQEKEATFQQTQLQGTKADISATPSTTSQRPKTFSRFTVNETPHLHESLKEGIVELSQTLLGDPSSRSAYQYRFGRKGSISVMVSGSNQGLYSNFESGVHGSPIKMIEEKLQLSSKEAIGWAKDWLGQTLTPTPIRSISPQQSLIKDQEKGTTWTPILPVPSHAPKPDIKSNPYLSYMTKEREVTSVYTYKDQQGQTLGYVARLEDKDGSKITPTLTYCENEKGQQHWRWKGFGDNRPLYGLDRLAENKPVLIVEGEKAADAAQKLLPNHAVLSWSGGVGAVNKADWSPLVGRDVTIWPDNDAPGQKAATQITQELAKLNQSAAKEPQIKIVDLPKDLPAKWDLADKMPETLTVDKVQSLVLSVGEEKATQQKTWAEMMKETAEEYKSMTFDQVFADIQRRNSGIIPAFDVDKLAPFSSEEGLPLAGKENHAVNQGIQTVQSEEVKGQSLVSSVAEEKATQQKTWAEIMKETAEEYKSMTFDQVFADIQRRNSGIIPAFDVDKSASFSHEFGLHSQPKDGVSGWGNVPQGNHFSSVPLESGKIGQNNALHAPSIKPVRPKNNYDLAGDFLKEYQLFERAEKLQIIIDNEKSAFEEKSLAFMKTHKEAYEIFKSTCPDFGKRIEKIAMEQERSRELLQSQSRGFDFSR